MKIILPPVFPVFLSFPAVTVWASFSLLHLLVLGVTTTAAWGVPGCSRHPCADRLRITPKSHRLMFDCFLASAAGTAVKQQRSNEQQPGPPKHSVYCCPTVHLVESVWMHVLVTAASLCLVIIII